MQPTAATSHTTPTNWMARFILDAKAIHYYIFDWAGSSNHQVVELAQHFHVVQRTLHLIRL